MMDQTRTRDISPYRVFTKEEWSRLRADTPLTLDEADLVRIRSLNDPVSLDEVAEVYLPLSRLLSYYVEATQGLYHATSRFLGSNEHKVPFIIGIAGSVAGGKSTTARLLKALLARWPSSPKVELVTTDGFLLPNAVLEQENLMNRKGFPESYDRGALLEFVSQVKAGKRNVQAPVYSHFYYDVIPGDMMTVDRPDILIFEGLNVLQAGRPKDGSIVPFVSDFFDFAIYIDANEDDLRRWYVERFFRLRETAFRDPDSYFYRYSQITEEEALETANRLWTTINLKNLRENILPTLPRADLIIKKSSDHSVDTVSLRKV